MTQSELSQLIPQNLPQALNDYAALLLLLLAVFITALYLSRRPIKRLWSKIRSKYAVNHLGYKQIYKLKCSDGLGYHFIIDQLILRHDGITVLAHKQYQGKIYCADNIDLWTQMLGQKSYRFDNPLHDLDCQIEAISACIPNISVDGYLFFDHQAEFPKGRPERVIYADVIPEVLRRKGKSDVDATVMSAWEKLKLMAKE